MCKLFLICMVFPQADVVMKPQDVVKTFEQRLKSKGTQFPYFAEYERSTPPQSNGYQETVTRRYFAPDEDTFYAEFTHERNSWRILIQEGQFYWAYSDSRVGTILSQADVDLKGKAPDAFLLQRQFFDISFKFQDQGILGMLRNQLSDSRGLESEQDKQTRSLTLTTKDLGTVKVTITPSLFHVRALAEGDKKSWTILKYRYASEKPDWEPDPVEQLLNRYEEAAKSDRPPRRLPKHFTMDTFFDQLQEETSNKSIPIKELRQVARRCDYLLPDREKYTVLDPEGIVVNM